jgi:CRISPR system Cascade subunit CasE
MACRVDAGPPDPRAVAGKITGFRNRASVTVATVVFDGVLEISDQALFLEAVRHGIGRAKSYGQGLLSVAATSEET